MANSNSESNRKNENSPSPSPSPLTTTTKRMVMINNSDNGLRTEEESYHDLTDNLTPNIKYQPLTMPINQTGTTALLASNTLL
eukprot:Awhi_evm1s10991